MPLGPYDMTGPEFLYLYASLLAGAIVAGFLVPIALRPAGRSQRVTDPDQLAFLAGGGRRFREAVVARLLASRRLVMTGRNRFKAIPGDRTGSGMGDRILTLTTCNPLFSTAERLIAYATFEAWYPREGGAPAEIAGTVQAEG